jgi:DNA-binding LytR/AlgR family response regulator
MFFANGTKEEVFERLGEIEKKLPSEIFFRAGKSVIINQKYIRKITDTTLQLVAPSANYQVEISREAIRHLKGKIL